MSIEISDQQLKCSYDTDNSNLVSSLKESLSWICLIKRNEIQNRISVSRGYWDCDRFFLEAMLPVDWSGSCWTHTLEHGIIASLDSLIPRAPLLFTTFPIAFQLAAVSTPSRFENGWYFFGGFTALIPVEKRTDGSILWHFESTEDDILTPSRLQSLKRRWYQTDLDELVSSHAVIGWSARGAVMFGSQASTDLSSAAHTHNNRLLKLTQVNIQTSLQFLAVLTIASAATIAPLDNRIKRSPPLNYGRLLQTMKHKPWIIYDVAGKRAWMIPLVSLVHQMILATPTVEGQNPPPCAPITIDGSGSLDVLTKNADHVVWQMGGNRTLLRDLVFDLVDQLYRTEPLFTRTNDLVGYQLADIINGEATMQPLFVTLQPKPSWVSLLKSIPCLLADHLGEVIVSLRSPVDSSACNLLQTGQNLLATTVQTLSWVSRRCGQKDLNNGSWLLPRGRAWGPTPGTFSDCGHDGESGEGCWANPEFIQIIQHKAKYYPEVEIPETGVVVFGAHYMPLRGLIERLSLPSRRTAKKDDGSHNDHTHNNHGT